MANAPCCLIAVTRWVLLSMAMVVLLAGCGGSAPVQPNVVARDAIALTQRAARAYEQRDYARAAALYEQALTLNASIENIEGIAASRLSLARVHQAAGNVAGAHAALDALLTDGPLGPPPERVAEAQARKAQLHLDAAEVDKAREWCGKALASCTACTALATIQTLRGRIALAAGDTASALAWAGKAMGAGLPPQSPERANALRLTGEAHLAEGKHAQALIPLAQALELDRGLGLSPRIHADLMLIGHAHAKLGDKARARDYFLRARSVSTAAGDAAASKAAERALAGL